VSSLGALSGEADPVHDHLVAQPVADASPVFEPVRIGGEGSGGLAVYGARFADRYPPPVTIGGRSPVQPVCNEAKFPVFARKQGIFSGLPGSSDGADR
jgi:hypothetical protein